MTTADTPQGDAFRLSMLWGDARYRSTFLQVIALVLVLCALYFLYHNASTNLAEQGKTFDFGFMGEIASYDINQRLIPYSSQSSHFRAALVGILNTLLVAVLGCALATVLGVVFGVLRLSKNWIISRLAAVYVEAFRNVPVLLWIVLGVTIFSETLPHPKQAESMLGGWLTATNRGFYIPAPVLGPLSWLLGATLLASIIGVILFRRWARARQEETGAALPVFWISAAGLLPPVLLWAVLGEQALSFEYPALKGFNFQGGIYLRNSLIGLWLALSLYTGAFIAEIVRSGILAISHGQTEAAYALGLRPNRTMNLVILPQALRVIIPPLISQYLNLTKNSSLAIAVGYMDVTATLGGITLNQTGKAMECVLLLMAFYLTVSLAISGIMNLYNNSVKLVER